jgi:hypothetical protein
VLAGRARLRHGPLARKNYVRVRCTARPTCNFERGSRSRVAIGSCPVRAGLAWARPEWGDVMLKRPPGRMAVGRAGRRVRDQVVKLSRNPGRDPSLGAREKLKAAGCRDHGQVTPPEWARAEPGREVAFAGREGDV